MTKGFKLQYKGLKYGGSSVRQSLNNYLDVLTKVGEEEAKTIADEIIMEAKMRVNYDTGRLFKSGKRIDVPSIRNGFKWIIRFSAFNPKDGFNYAYIQHENPYNRSEQLLGFAEYDSGWHYLQIPFEEHMRTIMNKFADKMRRV